MKKYVFFALAGVMICSCNKGETIKNDYSVGKNPITFVANADNSGTKTYLDDDGSTVNWNYGDEVKIFGTCNGEPTYCLYQAIEEGAKSTLEYSDGEGYFTEEDNPQYAIYPSSAEECSSDGIIKFEVYNSQLFSENSFGEESNVAVGQVTSTVVEGNIHEIYFKNVFGYLRLKLSDKTATILINKIVLTTKGEENLWGTFTVNAAADKPVASHYDGGSNSITLECGGHELTPNETAFYFVLPVNALSSGFSAEIYGNGDDSTPLRVLETTKDMTITRNVVKAMENVELNP